MSSSHAANIDRFSGFADTYDAHRPSPPAAMVEVLTQLAQVGRPRLVVDLGCGTGLSTRIWAGKAEQVIGIDPNDDMRRQAQERTAGQFPHGGISYQVGHATDTGLPDGCADIVTCCQCLHWMEPEPTFAEIVRILRPGGVFAACDADFPPITNWQVDAAYSAFHARVAAMEQQTGIAGQIRRWHKSHHLERIQASGRFRWTSEFLLHHVEMGNTDRLIGLSLSFGAIPSLLRRGVTLDELGLPALRNAAQQILGDTLRPWHFSFRVRAAVK
jgi:ubiquinone/menaquinone biosynthesis C-methylase UbiE